MRASGAVRRRKSRIVTNSGPRHPMKAADNLRNPSTGDTDCNYPVT
jgi:hypothetical protein